MNIDKAITIKRIWIDSGYAPPGPNEVEADNMSIEALKREKAHRQGGIISTPYLLPGETEE